MVGFTEKMHLKGKAEEDLYFAKLDKKLIRALHEKQGPKASAEAELAEQNTAQQNVKDNH